VSRAHADVNVSLSLGARRYPGRHSPTSLPTLCIFVVHAASHLRGPSIGNNRKARVDADADAAHKYPDAWMHALLTSPEVSMLNIATGRPYTQKIEQNPRADLPPDGRRPPMSFPRSFVRLAVAAAAALTKSTSRKAHHNNKLVLNSRRRRQLAIIHAPSARSNRIVIRQKMGTLRGWMLIPFSSVMRDRARPSAKSRIIQLRAPYVRVNLAAAVMT
jgi:hypothetical protein